MPDLGRCPWSAGPRSPPLPSNWDSGRCSLPAADRRYPTGRPARAAGLGRPSGERCAQLPAGPRRGRHRATAHTCVEGARAAVAARPPIYLSARGPLGHRDDQRPAPSAPGRCCRRPHRVRRIEPEARCRGEALGSLCELPLAGREPAVVLAAGQWGVAGLGSGKRLRPAAAAPSGSRSHMRQSRSVLIPGLGVLQRDAGQVHA